MNRREKRLTSKRLGILQYQQKLPRNKKFELIRENIIASKKREVEVAEEVRQKTNAYVEEKESQIILHLAEDIAKREKIPLIDAMEKAKMEYLQS
jgi:hypothetical protein